MRWTTLGDLAQMRGLAETLLLVGAFLAGLSVVFAVPAQRNLDALASLGPAYVGSVLVSVLAGVVAATGPRPARLPAALATGLLIILLWVVPVLVGVWPPGSPHALAFQGFAGYLADTGMLNPAQLFYHNWPGMWSLLAEFYQLGTWRDDPLIVQWFPVLFQLITTTVVLILARGLARPSTPNAPWVAAILWNVGNWVGQGYASPQALGMVLLLAVFVGVLQLGSGPFTRTDTATTLAAVGLLALTHLLAAVTATAVLLATLLWPRGNRRLVGVVSLIMIAAWMTYAAAGQFAVLLPTYVEAALKFLDLFQIGIRDRLFPVDQSSGLVAQLKLLSSLIVVAMGGAGMLIVGRDSNLRHYRWFIVLGFGAALAVGIATNYAYVGEIVERTYLYVFAPLILAASALAYYRAGRVLLVAGIVALGVINPTVRYGRPALDSLSPATLTVLDAIGKSTSSTIVGILPDSYLTLWTDYPMLFDLQLADVDNANEVDPCSLGVQSPVLVVVIPPQLAERQLRFGDASTYLASINRVMSTRASRVLDGGTQSKVFSCY